MATTHGTSHTAAAVSTHKRHVFGGKAYKNRRSTTKLYGDCDTPAPLPTVIITSKPHGGGGDGGDDTDNDVKEIVDDTEDVLVSLRHQLDNKDLLKVGNFEPDYTGLSAENVERLRVVVRRFVERRKSSRVALTEEPLSDTPSSTSVEVSTVTSERDEDATTRKQEMFKRRLAQIFGEDDAAAVASRAQQDQIKQHQAVPVNLCGKTLSIPWWIMMLVVPPTILSQSYGYIGWLAIVTCAFMYNAFAIPLRTLFDVQTLENWHYWVLADFVCDGIYLIDILRVRPLLKFVRDGVFIERRTETALNYFRSRLFRVDLLALLPLDLVFILFGQVNVRSIVRLPRMLKGHCYWEFFDRVETIASIPNVLRIFKTIMYMLYLVHINSGMYYSISYYERTVYNNTNEWVFVGTNQRHAYIRCTYQALKMAIKIGHNPIPFNSRQRAFHTFSLLMGIFVFAILVGQIRDIYSSISAREAEFRRKLDLTIRYLQKLKIPHNTIEKVRHWFIYSWKFQKTLDENDYLAILPRKLKTDLAINVHYNTIAKVQLFQDVEQGLISELVLMLKPRLYLPNEYVCRRGEVGKEMFIIKYGLVEVVGGGAEGGQEKVLATLGEGTVIGEIALLSLGGDNRRTAHVRSKGLSQLFVLSKEDLETALLDYPTTQDIIKKKARAIIRQNEKKRRATTAAQQPTAGKAEAESKAPAQQDKKVSVQQHHDNKPHEFDAAVATAASHPPNDPHYLRNFLHLHDNKADNHRMSNLFAKFLPRAAAVRQQLAVATGVPSNAVQAPEPAAPTKLSSPPTKMVDTSTPKSIQNQDENLVNSLQSPTESFRSRAMRRKTIVSPAALKAMHFATAGAQANVSSPSELLRFNTKRSASANEPLNQVRHWPQNRLESPTNAVELVETPTSVTSAVSVGDPHRKNAAMRRLHLLRSRRLAAKTRVNFQNVEFRDQNTALLRPNTLELRSNTRQEAGVQNGGRAAQSLVIRSFQKSSHSDGTSVERGKLLADEDGCGEEDFVQMVTVL